MGQITASDIQALGQKIATMYANRQNPIEGGLYTSHSNAVGFPIEFSSGVYGSTETTSQGNLIDANTYNKTIGIVNAIAIIYSNNAFSRIGAPAAVSAGDKIITQEQYNNTTYWVNGFYNVNPQIAVSSRENDTIFYTSDEKRNISGCNVFCTGLCAGTCWANCTQGCMGDNTAGESLGCNRCSASCQLFSSYQSSCGDSYCATICTNYCTGCGYSCSGNCGGCGTGCGSGCGGGCSQGCSLNCFRGCYGSCSNSCINSNAAPEISAFQVFGGWG